MIVLVFLVGIGSRYLLSLRLSSFSGEVPATESPIHQSPSIETQSPPGGIPEAGTPVPGFADNFDSGLSPNWSVHYGDALIRQGQLTSSVGAGLAAGDASWKNYRIEFDVDTGQVGCSFVDTSSSIGVRVKDFDHADWFVFTDCSAGWSRFAGGIDQGTLSLFPETQVDTVRGRKHFTIQVEQSKLSAYQDGKLLTSLIDADYQTGGIFLQVEAQTLIDHFQVTLLP